MTEALRSIADQIIGSNAAIAHRPIKRVLVLYEEDMHFLGDSCLRFGKLWYFRECFKNAYIHLNFRPAKKHKFGTAILKNNPNLDHLSILDWGDLDLDDYDVIFCVSYAEDLFLEYLRTARADELSTGRFKPAIFSLSKTLLQTISDPCFSFPEYHDLIDDSLKPLPVELYIDDKERKAADNWLLSKGVEDGDDLFVFCDSSSAREKLLNIEVYFELLEFLLVNSCAKMLIFDEKGIGKAQFYRSFLGDQAMSRLIVSEQLTLREDISLLASRPTKLIFGPCTGLLHCASGIYNRFVANGTTPASEVPLIVTYTGSYQDTDQNASVWWNNSPLVKCLMVKNIDCKKRLRLLSDLSEQEKALNDSLPCSAYTTPMLVNFLYTHLALIPDHPKRL